MNWNSGFSIGSLPGLNQAADNLTKNPFGSANVLNIGGFTGQTPGYGGAAVSEGLFGNLGGPMSFLAGSNSFMGGMQQANLNESAQNQFDAANAIYDADFGRDMLAQNFDRFRSFRDPVIAAEIAVNDPSYRQALRMKRLPELAGKYGRTGAFLS